MLPQTSQIASNFAANFCVFKLISSITSPLADDDYKIVIESFQHIFIVVFHSCSLQLLINLNCYNAHEITSKYIAKM